MTSMGSTESVDVALRITAALDYVRLSKDENIRAHHLWELEQVTQAVGLEDLTTAELVTLLSVLIPAHTRVLTGRPSVHERPTGSLLRLVSNQGAAANLLE